MDSVEKTARYAGSIIIILLALLTIMVIPCNSSEINHQNNSEKIPKALVLIPDRASALLVEKSSQRIFLYSSHNGKIHKVFGFACSTGEKDGVKSRAGDKKTPEGVYFFNNEYEDRYLAPVYGKKAFSTNYPNFLDRLAGRDGSAIWLHGTNKKLKPRDSNGCVAMNNGDILKFAKYIRLNSTPMIVVNKIAYTNETELESEKKDILQLIDNWMSALERGDYHDYLEFYDSNYLPDMTWWTQWWKIRKKIEEKGFHFKLLKGQSGIYRSSEAFVTLFDFGLELSSKRIQLGKREIFIKKNKAGYKIIGDPFLLVSYKTAKNHYPLCYAATMLASSAIAPHNKQFSFSKFVKMWLKAWSSKDMDKYAAFYSKKFHSEGMNKQQWIARKKRLANKYKKINIIAKNIRIHKGRKKTIISFLQIYKSKGFGKSKGFSAIGIKTLVLVKKGNSWKIYRESWKRR